MATTEELRGDHELILGMLDCFEAALAEARDAQTLKSIALAPFVEFFRDFADHCHHLKEEQSLFPALVRAGLPARLGPVGCMLDEHRAGRDCLAALDEAVAIAAHDEGRALGLFQQQGRAYIDLLRNHIAKENGVLFVMADDMLRGDEATRVLSECDALQADADYAERVRRGRTLAAEMHARYR